MIVSKAESKTVECFCFGFGLDFVFLVNPTFIPFKWQQARVNYCIVFYFDIFFQTSFTLALSQKKWEGTCPQAGTCHPPRVSTGALEVLGWGGGKRELGMKPGMPVLSQA